MSEATVAVSVDKLAGLAIEQWRLTSTLGPVLDAPGLAPIRHALRKIDDFLAGCHVETRELTGHPYDAGLAVRVVDTVVDKKLPRGIATITETLAPLVLINGTVVRPADVVIAANQ